MDTVTIGPERSEETIRMALATGVDRAIQVRDDALETADPIDAGTEAGNLLAVAEEVADMDPIVTDLDREGVAALGVFEPDLDGDRLGGDVLDREGVDTVYTLVYGDEFNHDLSVQAIE